MFILQVVEKENVTLSTVAYDGSNPTWTTVIASEASTSTRITNEPNRTEPSQTKKVWENVTQSNVTSQGTTLN